MEFTQESRSSLEYGTKLVGHKEARWSFVLYPALYPGAWSWVVRDARPLTFPVMQQGRLGLWRIELPADEFTGSTWLSPR